MFALAVGVNYTDPKFLHSNNIFDPVDSCKAINKEHQNQNFNTADSSVENNSTTTSKSSYRGGGGGGRGNNNPKTQHIAPSRTLEEKLIQTYGSEEEARHHLEIMLSQRGISADFKCAL